MLTDYFSKGEVLTSTELNKLVKQNILFLWCMSMEVDWQDVEKNASHLDKSISKRLVIWKILFLHVCVSVNCRWMSFNIARRRLQWPFTKQNWKTNYVSLVFPNQCHKKLTFLSFPLSFRHGSIDFQLKVCTFTCERHLKKKDQTLHKIGKIKIKYIKPKQTKRLKMSC